MRDKRVQPDVLIARIAAQQHGVISVAQLLAIGLTRAAISRRVVTGHLHPVFRGVYAVGHPGLAPVGIWMAAVLALGRGALLSHLSAAMLWELLPGKERVVDVTVLRKVRRRPRAGLVVHSSLTLTRGDLDRHRGIPVTSPGRTVADLHRAGLTGLASKATRQANYRGIPLEGVPNDGTFGDGEAILLGLCERNDLPAPEPNGRVGAFRVDYLWRPQAFGVEADDWDGHRGRQAFEDDHERGLELLRHGIELLPLTYRQLTKTPERVVEALRMRFGKDET